MLKQLTLTCLPASVVTVITSSSSSSAAAAAAAAAVVVCSSRYFHCCRADLSILFLYVLAITVTSPADSATKQTAI
jgi:hypothetical protein